MIRRLFYVIFLALGGILFAIPKWIIMGTKGGRQRKKLIRLQKEQNRLLRQR